MYLEKWKTYWHFSARTLSMYFFFVQCMITCENTVYLLITFHLKYNWRWLCYIGFSINKHFRSVSHTRLLYSFRTQIVMDYFYDSFVVIFGDWQSVLSFTFIIWECSSKKSVLQNENQMGLEQHKGEQKKEKKKKRWTLPLLLWLKHLTWYSI